MEKLTNLRVLYASNNKIKEWVEVERLGVLESLEELLLVGNPLYNDHKDAGTIADYRIEVGLQNVPNGVVLNLRSWIKLCIRLCT